MELRLLRYLVAVGETGSVSAAARKHHVAQPSVSRQIRAFERRLGHEIFSREPGGLVPTPFGRKYLEGASRVLNNADALDRVAESKFAPDALSFVCPPQLFQDVVVPSMLNGQFPLTRIFVRDSSAVEESVATGRIDFGISPIAPSGHVEHEEVFHTRLAIHAHRDLDLGNRMSLELEELPTLFPEGVVVLDRSRQTRRLFDACCQQASLDVTYRAEVEMAQTAQVLAARFRSACVTSDISASYGLQTIPLLFQGIPIRLPVYMIWEPNHPMKSEMLNLVKHMTQTGGALESHPE